MRWGAILLALAALAACSFDGPEQGVRAPCASASGALIGCEPVRVSDPEEACWRLVDCGVMPVDFPDDQNPDVLDWYTCMRFLERLPQYRLDFVLRCVSAASCDDLHAPDSPLSPDEYPLCLRFGRVP